jgi:hypothetical protein
VLVGRGAAHRREVQRRPVGPALLVEREAGLQRPPVRANGGELGGQSERLLESPRDAGELVAVEADVAEERQRRPEAPIAAPVGEQEGRLFTILARVDGAELLLVLPRACPKDQPFAG